MTTWYYEITAKFDSEEKASEAARAVSQLGPYANRFKVTQTVVAEDEDDEEEWTMAAVVNGSALDAVKAVLGPTPFGQRTMINN